MTGPTITMGNLSILPNPDDLVTVDELRSALVRANTSLMHLGVRLHEFNAQLHEANARMHRLTFINDGLAAEVTQLLVAHLQNEPVRVFELLSKMAKSHVRSVPTVNQDGAGRMH